MAKKKAKKKITTVREHSRRVRQSAKNPFGVTIVDQHSRRLKGTCLDADEIAKTVEAHDRKGLIYPSSKKLKDYPNADKYDEIIAIWVWVV